DPDGVRRRHAGDLLLPFRGIGDVVVIVRGDMIAAEPLAVDAILRAEKVKHAGDRRFLAVEIEYLDRDIPVQHVALRIAFEIVMLMQLAAEIGKTDGNNVIMNAQQRFPWADGAAAF